jgi:hypothetical protein
VWNTRADWVISTDLTHPPLITDQDYLAVQHITALRLPGDWQHRYPVDPTMKRQFTPRQAAQRYVVTSSTGLYLSKDGRTWRRVRLS